MITLLFSFGIAALFFFFVWQRKNKWIFIAMWFCAMALSINAIGQGCGEPLGRQYLKKAGELTPQQKQMKEYYYGNLSGTRTTSQAPATTGTPPESEKTWLWPLIGLLFLIGSLIVSAIRTAEISAAAGKTLIKTGGEGLGQILKEIGIFIEKNYADIKAGLKKLQEDRQTYRLLKLKGQTDTAPKPKEADLTFFQRYFPSLTADASWTVASNFFSKNLLKIAGKNKILNWLADLFKQA